MYILVVNWPGYWWNTDLNSPRQWTRLPWSLEQHIDGECENVANESDGFEGADRERDAESIHIPVNQQKNLPWIIGVNNINEICSCKNIQ